MKLPRLRGWRAHVALAAMLLPVVVTGLTVAEQSVASAHVPGATATCSGVHLTASNYDAGKENTWTATIDGQTQSGTFGATLDKTLAVPQGGATTTWSATIQAYDGSYKGTYDGTVGPCGTSNQKKVYVCKYVGTPGVDERLQTGQNPIEVSVDAIQHNEWDGQVPGWFSDAHDRSYVLGYVPMNPEPTVQSCPAPQTPPTKATVNGNVTFTEGSVSCVDHQVVYTSPTYTVGGDEHVIYDTSRGVHQADFGQTVDIKATGVDDSSEYQLGTPTEWTHTFAGQPAAPENCVVPPPTINQCTTITGPTVVTPSNLQGFDFSETRSTGHYEFTDNGLHIYTESNTSTDKVAAYKAVNVPLSEVGAPSLTYSNNSGTQPGFQLYIDNGHGVAGYVVGEPSAYGDNWWSTKDFGVGAGMGYTSYGTLNDYLAANPDATVQAFGFSLGSGVKGDGVLSKITFACQDWTFAPDQATKDATASVTVSRPTCDSTGIASATEEHAKLVGTLDQSVGTHTATFKSDDGHAFADGTDTLQVSYTIPGKDTSQCPPPPPTTTTVTPTAPTVTTPTCASPNETVSWPTPSQAGVIRTPEGSTTLAPGQSVSYTAVPATNVVFPKDAQTSWNYRNTFDTQSCVIPPPVVKAPTASVTGNCHCKATVHLNNKASNTPVRFKVVSHTASGKRVVRRVTVAAHSTARIHLHGLKHFSSVKIRSGGKLLAQAKVPGRCITHFHTGLRVPVPFVQG